MTTTAPLDVIATLDSKTNGGDEDPSLIRYKGVAYRRVGDDGYDADDGRISLSRLFHFLASFMVPGVGMFLEAYYIFSIGNIKPILQAQYPACWKNYTSCSKTLVQSVDYIQICGIITGMCTMGYLGDRIGRKWGSVSTVSIMLVGAILLTAQSGTTDKGQLIMYMIAQFVFGYGTGGEYPMASGSASERAEQNRENELAGGARARKRGREVVLTFSMQGVGNFVNTLVLVVLLFVFQIGFTPLKAGTSPPGVPAPPPYTGQYSAYGFDNLNGVWRTAFALGIVPILFAIYYRVRYLKESEIWQKNAATQQGSLYQITTLFKYYTPRMISTCGCWFFWDFSFYGNKLFQSSFIAILAPGGSLAINLEWTLLNSGVALFGYYFAATYIDHRYWGRVRIQVLGFAMVSILFFICAAKYHTLLGPANIHLFQFLYFLSSFWGQFGPNCTTWLLAGEVYPTAIRTTAHGISAGVAKLGALWAAAWFNYLDNRKKFWYCAAMNTVGLILTIVFTPEPNRMNLAELDRRFRYTEAGKVYHGEAVNPSNLSYYEWITGQGKHYNPQLDREDRIADGLLADRSVPVGKA